MRVDSLTRIGLKAEACRRVQWGLEQEKSGIGKFLTIPDSRFPIPDSRFPSSVKAELKVLYESWFVNYQHQYLYLKIDVNLQAEQSCGLEFSKIAKVRPQSLVG
jgi:hypothetical protein